ncbi:MAG: hypothetical protein NTU83_04820, partial [Candidatus Hydrogenedentes bacterium]|nr:hypothetical protein [Candidatus Hydrogenedentota bacterium]
LEFHPASGPWRVQPTPAATEWGWKTAASFGTDRNGSIATATSSNGVVVLGLLEGTTDAALCADERNGIAVFPSVPRLPASLLRTVARNAGVHMYIDTEDIVWAGRDLLAVSVNEGGPRTIRLPRPYIVTDLWSGQTVARDTDHFIVDIPGRGTALFRLTVPAKDKG